MDFDKYDYVVKYPPETWNDVVEGGLALKEQFKADLFEDLGIVGNPKADVLFRLAWELGHLSGYSEVYYYASDLVELIV